MEQTLLRISTSSQARLYPAELRQMVAALDMKSPALFARGPDGITQNYPGVCFVGGPTWVGATADPEHKDVLMANLGYILLEVNKYMGQPCPFNVESRVFDIERTQYPLNYRVFNMAIKSRSQTRRTKEPIELVTEAIYKSIEQTCIHYGLDCPEQDELGLMNVVIDRHHGMLLKTSYTDKGEYVGRFNASFSLHADLKGVWQLGNIKARGHGMVQRNRAIDLSKAFASKAVAA